MTEKPTVSCFKRAGLAALTGLSLWLHTPQAQSQEPIEDQAAKTVVTQVQAQPLVLNKRSQASHDAYILGPGDGLLIELLDLPELSGRFSIGPDGLFIYRACVPSMWRASLWRSCASPNKAIRHLRT